MTSSPAGGDEFAVIVTGITPKQASDMARRLQTAVNRLTWGVAHEPVSISVGVAVAEQPGIKATELVARADRRMYAARSRERGPQYAPRRQERRRQVHQSPFDGDG
jgi:diguanylate cyclase (GGDEF)-like protein